MDSQPILAVFLLLTISVGGDKSSSCTDKETKNVNECLFQFVAAHHQHRTALVDSKHCKLDLLNCGELDKAYICLNDYKLSAGCTDTLETTIDKYIADLSINCTVAEFNLQCPDATKIARQTSASSSTPSDTSSSARTTLTLVSAVLVAMLQLMLL